MTPKQIRLLSNLADSPNTASELKSGVVSAFRHTNCVFSTAHVVGSMLRQLSNKGLCYHTLVQGRAHGVKVKRWHITELGLNRLFNEVAEENQNGCIRRR